MAARNEIETDFNYCENGDDKGYFSSSEGRWVTHIRKLAEKYPDKCIILKQPEENGGFIYARLPTSWLKVSPPKKVVMTEEQRIAAAERLRKARESNKDD